MGYYPETQVCSFPPYPGHTKVGGKPKKPLLNALYALQPWIGFDIWHIDPEKPSEGQRTDDSCGWFDRRPQEYGDAVTYLLKDGEFMRELERMIATRRPMDHGGYVWPRMDTPTTLAACLMTAEWLERRRWWNGQGGKEGACFTWWRKTFTKERNITSVAYSLALNPTDNLSSMEDSEAFLGCMAAALHRHFRPWWKHPRWHVHHWKINFMLVRNIKRMFERCATCNKPLGFGYCPIADGQGVHHHQCRGIYATAAQQEPAE